ncbi:hypothetical protein Ddye_024073 [Dipteronia dyeriana]|uniref:RRM domain-containing protein n=1 Tax=Dipteronia dyeriana TaxID=168575 RepID=A0AAD9TV21_9ROSI|nr:hypothetical protein Ddye_024073 [Dipteronia dyeriana]
MIRDIPVKLHSIFIDDLNPVVDQVCLWGIFKPHGKVRDIFLSPRSNSKGSTFAFIRFESEEEAERVAKRVDGMHVYGWPIRANMASYGWNKRMSGRTDRGIMQGKEGLIPEKARTSQSRHAGYQEQSKNKTFSEVVKRNLSDLKEGEFKNRKRVDRLSQRIPTPGCQSVMLVGGVIGEALMVDKLTLRRDLTEEKLL